jgi:hypothetical protein
MVMSDSGVVDRDEGILMANHKLLIPDSSYPNAPELRLI